MDRLLGARNIGFAFAGSDALFSNVTIDVVAGQSIAIVGSSGSGKTTLLRVLAGLQAPTTGTLERAADHKLGFVFQQDALLPWRRAGKNIEYPLECEGVAAPERATRARGAFERMRLPLPAWRRFPSQLSGGERRRLSIAMNIVRGVDILLLDEPTAQLDEPNRWNVQSVLQDLLNNGVKSLVVVTHDIDEALMLADVVYVLRDGALHDRVRVDLPRPRAPQQRNTPEFATWRELLINDLLRGVP